MKGGKHGADPSYLKILLDSESSTSNPLKDYDKRLQKVKDNLSKAIQKLLKLRLNDDEKKAMEAIHYQINNAFSASDLVNPINQALETTHRFKEW